MHVNRPGARVISRTGYAIGATPTPADRRRAIDAALGAPFTQQGLKLEYTTYVGQSAVTAQQRVAVSLVAQLPVRRAGGAATGDDAESADVVFVVRDSRTGQAAASGSDEMRAARQARTRRLDRQFVVAGGVRSSRRRIHHAVRRPRARRHRRQRGSAVQGPCARRARCRGHGPDSRLAGRDASRAQSRLHGRHCSSARFGSTRLTRRSSRTSSLNWS